MSSSENPSKVAGDELLKSLFGNVIENAVRHNDSQPPTVTISGEVQSDSITVSVADNGSGLPEAVQHQLTGADIPHPQTGIHIITSLVERYDGRLSLTTTENGTTISIQLPRSDEA